ncbi:MAG TPA: 2-oxo-4-hydroxy-4-carboxy-5-ureidoimidazoline decarboxylase [Abditibacterium sp.]|jgi:2-oxo-4-hydroxy-4-carboxy-5-ureidoimidazoline decarboxylase
MNISALQKLNSLNEKDAFDALLRCCGASKWVLKVMAARPFADFDALLAASDAAFASLQEIDWLEAFSHHPKLGDLASLRAKFASTRDWAGAEQAGTSAASEIVLQELARCNAAYEARFGFIFILCATGKSADEMLQALRNRLGNERETEIGLAAEQQKQITRLRLEKLEL